jgi:DNA polymerase (family 10)
VKNAEIAKVFQDIADLLELKEENIFKIRAYQRAVRSIEYLPVELEQMAAEGKLKEIPGVGEAIARKITELVTTGHLGYYDKLKAEFPEGVSALLDIPGVGPKTALLLSRELEVGSADELEAAIIGGQVARLYRMGDKAADNILHRIQAMRHKDRRIPIGEVLPVVDEITAQLQELPGLRNLVPAGSLRRFLETIGDIDLMGTTADAVGVLNAFTGLPQVKEVLASGTTKASVVVSGDWQVDLRIVEPDSFGSLLQYFTGSKQHNINLRERARRRGLSLSEYGITELATGRLEKYATEEAFYHRLGLQYIPPEIREGQHELERAEQGDIPELVRVSDIKGDLHVHTNWSDGRDSIEAMARAARDLGYGYLCVSDHSAGEIRDLNGRLDGVHIFTGMEVDVRADGSLDMSDALLGELDIVTAAVHAGLGESRERMTRRLIMAMENPHVDVLAHPTGRLLPGREPVAVDMEAIFQTAARTGTALEINAMPSRIDLKDIHAYRARELGVRLVINTDAHAAEHLGFMRFGIGAARRGWCQPEDILNTRPLAEVRDCFSSQGKV